MKLKKINTILILTLFLLPMLSLVTESEPTQNIIKNIEPTASSTIELESSCIAQISMITENGRLKWDMENALGYHYWDQNYLFEVRMRYINITSNWTESLPDPMTEPQFIPENPLWDSSFFRSYNTGEELINQSSTWTQDEFSEPVEHTNNSKYIDLRTSDFAYILINESPLPFKYSMSCFPINLNGEIPYVCPSQEDPRYYNQTYSTFEVVADLGQFDNFHWFENNIMNGNVTSLYYDLIMNLDIDSDKYDKSNVRTFIYMPIIYNMNLSDPEGYEYKWQEVDPYNTHLTSPIYRLKIIDKLTSDLLFEDTQSQYFKSYREVSFNSFKVINNYEQTINFTYTTDTFNKSILINPFDSRLALNESSSIVSYTITDLFDNILEINQANSSEIVYTPPYFDECQITYVDQFGEFIDFENYLTYIDNIQIPRSFYSSRNSTISIETKTLNNELIQTTNYLVKQGSNLITIPVDSLRVNNFWDNGIITYISALYSFDTYYPNGKIDNSDYYDFSIITNPLEKTIINYTTSSYYYAVADIYNNTLKTGYIDGSTNQIDYIPLESTPTIINFVNQDGDLLEFNNYNTYLNNTRVYEQINDLFINSLYQVSVFDVLNNSVYTGSHIINRTDNEIIIELQVYQLKIMNLMITETDILIENYLSPYSIEDIINPYELLIYELSPADYNITYTNELDAVVKYELTLDDDKTFLLQTLQKPLQISLFDESGFGVSVDNVRIYYDGTRTNGMVQTFDGTHHIKVMDFFNSTLYDGTIDITAYTEFNVYLPIYTLILQNYSNETMQLIIEREGVPFAVIDQQIAGNTGYQFRFAKDLEYIVSWIYLNGTLALQSLVELDSNVEISSFGFSSKAEYLQISDKISTYEYVIFIVVGASLLYLGIRLIRNRPIITSAQSLPKTKKRNGRPRR